MDKVLALHTPRGALFALAVLSLLWGYNWLVLKMALAYAAPLTFTIERTLVGAAALFAVLLWQERPFWPQSWAAVIIIGFFQITLNFGAAIMALVSGGAGRTAVLTFTMPFWTMLLAWPILGERVRGAQWLAVALALGGLTLILQPWNWHEGVVAKLYAVFSGVAWAAAAIGTKYAQRNRTFDVLNFSAWHMLIGVVPLVLLDPFMPAGSTAWTVEYVLVLLYSGVISTALGWIIWLSVLRRLPAGTASLGTLAIPIVALLGSMLQFDERLDALEWLGIALIGGGLAVISWRGVQSGRQLRPPEAGTM